MRPKKILSVIVVIALLFSMTAMLWSSYPGTIQNQMPDSVPDEEGTSDNMADGPSTLGPLSSDPEVSDDVELSECDEGTNDGASLTSIVACKEACGFWYQEIIYDWAVSKTIVGGDEVTIDEGGHSASAQVAQGDSVTIVYQIVAERTLVSVDDRLGVRGQVTVRNTGLYPTENLVIMDHVQMSVGDACEDVAVFQIDVSEHPILYPGESYSYAYEFTLDAEPGANYRNIAYVSISNMIDGPQPVSASDLFTIPCEPVVNVVDENARLIEVLNCPEGYQCNLDSEGPWLLSDDETIFVTVEVRNFDAPCDEISYLRNIVKLTELDTCQCHQDCAIVALTSECECGGYTLTIGYWKNHDGTGPQDDEITPLINAAGGVIWLGTAEGEESVAVTNAAEAVNYLDRQGQSSNGINRLYAQLLAAKLNILNGACDNAIEDTISAADAFLATHSAEDWDGLSADEQQMVNEWKDMLDDYNNGVIGPGHQE